MTAPPKTRFEMLMDANDKEIEERRTKMAQLAWFEKREQWVRALVGAVEDAPIQQDCGYDEWRMLVDWEMENRKP